MPYSYDAGCRADGAACGKREVTGECAIGESLKQVSEAFERVTGVTSGV